MLKDDGDPDSERVAECLIPTCNMKYPVPKQHGDYLRHLLEDHKIVIGMKISVTYLLFFMLCVAILHSLIHSKTLKTNCR